MIVFRGRLTSAGRAALMFVVIGILVGVTRLPVAPRYLFSFDSVNFALALERFDPRFHQPQPPGYPLFVAEARLVNQLFHSPQVTFVACGLIAAVFAPFLLFLLGSRMYSTWTGIAAALLLAVNPLLWHASLASPVRPYLALDSVLVAYLCWRAIHGEPRFAYFAAIALGLSSGWRPAQVVMLFPLWLGCACLALHSFRRIAPALALLVSAMLVWVVPLVVVIGGVHETWQLFSTYLRTQSEAGSPILGSAFWGWWKMFTQGFVWTALNVVSWCWALLLLAGQGYREEDGHRRSLRRMFLLAWLAPSAVFFTFVHVGHPGHLLAVVPAFCLLGGSCLERAARRVSEWLPRPYQPRWAFLTLALGISAWFFIYPFRIPHQRQTRSSAAQVVEQFRFWGAFALRDASYEHIRAVMLRTEARLDLLNALGDEPELAIVWQDDDVTWRKITYYFSDKPVWVLEGLNGPGASGKPAPGLWFGNRTLEARRTGDFAPLRLPARGRLAWLLHLGSSFPKELRAQGIPLQKIGPMFLTDLAGVPERFHAGPFVFYKDPLMPGASAR